jgi:hypothetical protein
MKLVALAFRVKPLLLDAWEKPNFIENPDLYRSVLAHYKVKAGEPATGLKPLGDVYIGIPVAARDFHVPTAAQVLSRLPENYHGTASAYSLELIDGVPYNEAGKAEYKVTLYQGPLPEAVRTESIFALGREFRHPDAKARDCDAVAEKPISVMKPVTVKRPKGPQP